MNKRITQNELSKIMPVKRPFLLIDKVLFCEPDKKVIALKRLTGKEWFLKGHFPGNPVMPGHLIAESMAQACFLLFKDAGKVKKQVFYLAASKARFFSVVRPGDELTITAYPVRVFPGAAILSGEAYAKSKLVAKGEFTVKIGGKK